MDVLDTGLGNALLELAVAVECVAVAEASSSCLHPSQTSVTVVESLVILPRTVISRRMKPAITAAEVAILLRTARSRRERESSAATTVANLVIWLATVIMQMSRSAILVENLDTFRKIVPKLSAIGKALHLRCGETGHVAINCSKTSEVNCYRCGESGHLARECTIEATA